jgi:predicted outer membrane repeat protein
MVNLDNEYVKYPLLILALLTSTALADTWTVDDDGKADFDNIQAAVDASSDGDEIIVMPGTYTSTADEVVNMIGKAVWLHSSEGQEVTIIDGEGTRRGIYCANGETPNTIIEGFTITNGYAEYYGGGMRNFISSPTLTDCTFTGNSAANYGGGMYNSYSNPSLTDCTFTNNIADYGGGMFNNSSSPTLDNCTFTDNTADNYGGGMANSYSNPTLTNCTIIGNASNYSGGGMYNNESNPTLTNCTFTNNTATTGDGGGMFNDYSNPTLTDTTVCGNTPDQIIGDWTDKGGNTIADECPIDCPDITGDGIINVSDLLNIIDQWGATNSPADVNSDGIVDVSDLLIVVGNWGPCN